MFIRVLPNLALRSAVMSPLSVPNFSQIGVRICVLWQILQSLQNEDKTKKLNENLIARISEIRSDFLQIWYADSPT